MVAQAVTADRVVPDSADQEVEAVTVAKAPAGRPMTISRTVRSVRIVPSDATDTPHAKLSRRLARDPTT